MTFKFNKPVTTYPFAIFVNTYKALSWAMHDLLPNYNL